MTKGLIVFTDGGARGNPGAAGIGAVIQDEHGNVLEEISEYIGRATNNQAEYQALRAALSAVQRRGAKRVQCFSDSELLVKQMRREYKVKNSDLAKLFLQVSNIVVGIGEVTFHHIPREKNKHADRLVNAAIDRALR